MTQLIEDEYTVQIAGVKQVVHQSKRYLIILDKAPSFVVHEEVMIAFRLVKGTKLALSLLPDIMRADEQNNVYIQVMKYVQQKHRTCTEIVCYLTQKGYEQPIIQEILMRLEQEQVVNDQQYAVQWADRRLKRNKKGRHWIQYELEQKGIDAQHIAAALQTLDYGEEWNSALDIARQKWCRIKGQSDIRTQKVKQFLICRGYPSCMAQQVAVAVAEEEEMD